MVFFALFYFCLGGFDSSKFGSFHFSKSKVQKESELVPSKSKIQETKSSDIDDISVKLNEEFSVYMKNIQSEIKKYWKPNKADDKTRAVVLFSVNKAGELIDAKILTSSGDEVYDKAALTAVKNAAPFAPLPKAFKGSKVDVQFTFDYRVHKLAQNQSPQNSNSKSNSDSSRKTVLTLKAVLNVLKAIL